MGGPRSGGHSRNLFCLPPVNLWLLSDLSNLFLSYHCFLSSFIPVSFSLSILTEHFLLSFLLQDEVHPCTYQSSELAAHWQHAYIYSSSPMEFSLMSFFLFVFLVFMVNKVFNKAGINASSWSIEIAPLETGCRASQSSTLLAELFVRFCQMLADLPIFVLGSCFQGCHSNCHDFVSRWNSQLWRTRS